MVACRFGSGRYDITNNENVIIILKEKKKDITFFFVRFAQSCLCLCSLPPPFQVRVGALPEKSCMFYEKSWKIILPVRGNVVPLHSLSEKNPVGKRKRDL